MFFLFFTTPAKGRRRGKDRRTDADQRRNAEQPTELVLARSQVLVTYGLVLIWLGLMTFGTVSMVNPKWLQELSRPGAAVEARTHKRRGDDALQQRRYRSAIAQYQRALEIKPDSLGALANLAIAYDRAEDGARAASILKEALQKGGEHARKGIIHYNLGEVLERQGDTEAALEHYREAIGLDVEQDLVYRKLGLLYLAAGDYENARQAFDLTLKCQLDLGLPYKYMLQRTLEACWNDSYVYGDSHEERAELAEVIQAQLAGDILPENLERYDLKIVRDLQTRDREIAKTHNHLGVIHARLGNVDDSIEHFQESLEIWPGNVDGQRNLKVLRQLRERTPRGTPTP